MQEALSGIKVVKAYSTEKIRDGTMTIGDYFELIEKKGLHRRLQTFDDVNGSGSSGFYL